MERDFFIVTQKMKKIAIQGVPGSYHDIAAHKFFKDEEIELICCNTFEEVFDNLKKDSSIIGMIAIENTIAGSLLHNYELLRDSGATIIGEHKLRISHSIMCLPGEDWSTLTEVNSSGSTGTMPGFPATPSTTEGGRNGRYRRQCTRHQGKGIKRTCCHLLQICSRALRHENLAGRH